MVRLSSSCVLTLSIDSVTLFCSEAAVVKRGFLLFLSELRKFRYLNVGMKQSEVNILLKVKYPVCNVPTCHVLVCKGSQEGSHAHNTLGVA